MPDSAFRCACGSIWWTEHLHIAMSQDSARQHLPNEHTAYRQSSRTTYTCAECGLGGDHALRRLLERGQPDPE
ncbi:MAG: hypothetical protein LC798_07505 [Chloroflexi bacterium]|nr:hypothetical protein [Chloroflexota bacterium]